MSDTLFDLPEAPSPRLQWMRKFRITTTNSGSGKKAWTAKTPTNYATGETEDDALANLAKKIGIMIWSEMLWKTGEI